MLVVVAVMVVSGGRRSAAIEKEARTTLLGHQQKLAGRSPGSVRRRVQRALQELERLGLVYRVEDRSGYRGGRDVVWLISPRRFRRPAGLPANDVRLDDDVDRLVGRLFGSVPARRKEGRR